MTVVMLTGVPMARYRVADESREERPDAVGDRPDVGRGQIGSHGETQNVRLHSLGDRKRRPSLSRVRRLAMAGKWVMDARADALSAQVGLERIPVTCSDHEEMPNRFGVLMDVRQ